MPRWSNSQFDERVARTSFGLASSPPPLLDPADYADYADEENERTALTSLLFMNPLNLRSLRITKAPLSYRPGSGNSFKVGDPCLRQRSNSFVSIIERKAPA